MRLMFLRGKRRFKNGKWHRYFSVVESRRLSPSRVVQRQVLYLGEINDSQEAAWRKTLEVFDERGQTTCQMSLFPEDREIPLDAVNALSLRMDQLKLRRARAFGDCWLGLTLWRQLRLDHFWSERLGDERGDVLWERVLTILAINRLTSPGSEWRIHREWFRQTALDELLGVDFAAAGKDRLYRCLDRLLEHKEALSRHLVEQWRTLFDAKFDVLLYDLTSTYFEGLCREIPKARHGYSRDGRPDCRQVVIALVVTPDGLPLAYEVMPGNTSDKTTLKGFLSRIESLYGKADRIWVMDRGIPTESVLAEMRAAGVHYLVGTPKSALKGMEQSLLERPWSQVHDSLQVKLLERDGEVYVLARSADRRNKERAIHRRKLKRLVQGLNALKRRPVSRDVLLQKIGALKAEAGQVKRFVRIHLPQEGEPVTRNTFRCSFDRAGWRRSCERDGAYLLRGYLPADLAGDGVSLWRMYMQLVQVEQAFKEIKSDLAVRPIHHQIEPRVEAHILVAFLGYALLASLRMRLQHTAPGLTPRAVLEKLSAIRLVDVCIPTTDGRLLVMPRYIEPEADQQLVLDQLNLKLPAQPPPRIRSGTGLPPTMDQPCSADL
ncbi:MAG: IS1634 family transposase [Planctomycetes bacterium]|nr:IS1634 family transposase [Planctomycetota bacterium]